MWNLIKHVGIQPKLRSTVPILKSTRRLVIVGK